MRIQIQCIWQCFGSGSRWLQVYSQIRIRVLKFRIRIRPFINLCDLNDRFDNVLEEPDQKRQCEDWRVLDMKYNIFYTFTLVLWRFFHSTDPDFSRSVPDFWLIRIRTKKKVWSGSGRQKPGSETLVYGIAERWFEISSYSSWHPLNWGQYWI